MGKRRGEKGAASWGLGLHISGDIKNMMKDHLEQLAGIIHEVLRAAICCQRGGRDTYSCSCGSVLIGEGGEGGDVLLSERLVDSRSLSGLLLCSARSMAIRMSSTQRSISGPQLETHRATNEPQLHSPGV